MGTYNLGPILVGRDTYILQESKMFFSLNVVDANVCSFYVILLM